MKHRNNEKGQSLIILAVAFVILLGFVALAIDGGMVYSDRRYAQNAADASSLAGGGTAALYLENLHVFYGSWDCNDGRITTSRQNAVGAASSRAQSNGFTIDNNDSDYNSVLTTCGQTDMGGWFDKYLDITTHISKTTDTSFAQFIFNGPLRNQVEAVVRVRPRSPLAFGHAVVGLNPSTDCNNNNKTGVVFAGSGETSINGGGIWSNGCLKATNNSCNVDVVNGDINYAGGRFPGTGALCESMTPAATSVSDVLPPNSYAVPLPNCAAAGAITIDSITSSMTLQSNKLYCITSSGNAIKLTGSDSLIGQGVTLFLVNGGDIEMSGGTVDIAAPNNTPDPAPAIPGILIYVNPVRDSIIKLTGNGNSHYLGVIYAPRADVSVEGSNGTHPTFNTQIISYNVTISGNASIDINFNEQQAYTKPSALELYK